MRIETESGAVYHIADGYCVKVDHTGYRYPMFAVWTMKALQGDEISDPYYLPDTPPEIGKRFYISGQNEWWISTPVVSIYADSEILKERIKRLDKNDNE